MNKIIGNFQFDDSVWRTMNFDRPLHRVTRVIKGYTQKSAQCHSHFDVDEKCVREDHWTFSAVLYVSLSYPNIHERVEGRSWRAENPNIRSATSQSFLFSLRSCMNRWIFYIRFSKQNLQKKKRFVHMYAHTFVKF